MFVVLSAVSSGAGASCRSLPPPAASGVVSGLFILKGWPHLCPRSDDKESLLTGRSPPKRQRILSVSFEAIVESLVSGLVNVISNLTITALLSPDTYGIVEIDFPAFVSRQTNVRREGTDGLVSKKKGIGMFDKMEPD